MIPSLMRFGIILLCLIVLLLLTAVLPAGKGLDASAVYYSPVFMLLQALLGSSLVWCCIKRTFSAKPFGWAQGGQIGFYLVHLGIVVILGGALVGYIAGKKGQLQLQLFHPVAAGGLIGEEQVPFGFEVAAKDFEVKFYPPVYHLYTQIPMDQLQPGQMPFEKTAEYDTTGKEVLDMDGIGRLAVSNLWNDAMGEWIPRRMIDSGAFLHRASQTPSHYGVTLQIVDGDKELELPVSINHPAGYKNWRFYLMSYDQHNRSYVVLSARNDPGRNWVIAGIWATLIGTFVLGFRKAGGGCRVAGVEGQQNPPRPPAYARLRRGRSATPPVEGAPNKGMLCDPLPGRGDGTAGRVPPQDEGIVP